MFSEISDDMKRRLHMTLDELKRLFDVIDLDIVQARNSNHRKIHSLKITPKFQETELRLKRRSGKFSAIPLRRTRYAETRMGETAR